MMKQRLTRRVTWIYAAALFLSLHYAFTVYINSNFLVQYFSQSEVSLLYTIGSAITIIFFIASPSLVRKFGNGRVLLTAIFLEATALFGIYMSQNSTAIATFFICIQALPPLLLFGLDVFLEDTLRSEKTTGRVRSMYLTIINFAFLLSPLIVGSIVQNYSYKVIYLIAAGFCFFLFFVVGDELQPVKMQSLEQVSFRDTVRKIIPRRSLRIVIFLDFLLQSFYALMVIYLSLYLHQTIGFNWATIGVLYTIMLVPFVLFEAPLGRLFDHHKIAIDTIVVGFVILALSVFTMAMTTSHSFIVWAILLFISRVGASFVEVGTEYSFFRRVTGRDAGFISFFRMTVPLGYMLVPLAGNILLSFITIPTFLLLFSCVLLSGIFYGAILRQAR